MEPFDVVVVGSANIDLVVHSNQLPQPGQTITASEYAEYAGGKGLNQAVACARMGARTAFIGCVGDDDAGRMLLNVLRTEGIDVSGVKSIHSPTGRAFITVDSDGENTIVVVPGANAFVGKNSSIDIPPCTLLLTQLEIPIATVASVLHNARGKGIRTILNPAPATSLAKEVIADSDIIVPNETEAIALGGVRALLDAGALTVVRTLGADGAEVVSLTMQTPISPYRVIPIDTVGAGDAFIGAMCAELSRGVSLEEACTIAAIAGALATTIHGAVPSLPHLDEVLKARIVK